jgi:hypothetical protein
MGNILDLLLQIPLGEPGTGAAAFRGATLEFLYSRLTHVLSPRNIIDTFVWGNHDHKYTGMYHTLKGIPNYLCIGTP